MVTLAVGSSVEIKIPVLATQPQFRVIEHQRQQLTQ